MNKYTSLNFKNLIKFLFKKKKLLFFTSLLFSFIISIILFISFNSLDSYYPEGKTEENILNKINRIEDEILYLEEVSKTNYEYIKNSIYYSFSETGATETIFSVKLKDGNLNEFLSILEKNFYVNIADISKSKVKLKYLKEIMYFYPVNNNLKFVLLHNNDKEYNLLYNSLLTYFDSQFKDFNYSLSIESNRILSPSNFENIKISFDSTVSDTTLSIKERQSELNVYKDLLNRTKMKLNIIDFFKMLTFMFIYLFLILLAILIILFIKIRPCMTKEQYEKEFELSFINNLEKKKKFYITDFTLVKIRIFNTDLENKILVINPGILLKKGLKTLINAKTNNTFYYSEDNI